jgi:hypothetical protein
MCALEAEFIHLATNATVCLTNMYLDPETDHNLEIYHYQESQIANNKFTIIGGDTNADGVEYYGLVGDLHRATSVGALKNTETEEENTEDVMLGDLDEYA